MAVSNGLEADSYLSNENIQKLAAAEESADEVVRTGERVGKEWITPTQ
jgi:hypothetical protein